MGWHIFLHCYKDALNATKRLHSLIECTFDVVYEITLKLACNMDLQWMAEAVLPRFGHGAFLLCLEDLYKKITGQELVYTALVGKPSEITYRHGEHILQHQAKVIYGDNLQSPLKNIYFVGDNVCTDILGANLYHNCLSSIHKGVLFHIHIFLS